jgi:hypothetical protein
VTSGPSESDTKEGRIARDVRLAWALGREPAAILPLLRRWLLKIWASRGGGFYGLGYVVTFAALEIKSLSVDLISVSGLAAQAIQYVIRFSIESFFNGLSALLWPVLLLRSLGGLGLVVLAVAYAVFERAIRPLVEASYPEIRDARAERARLRQEKKASRANRRDGGS